MDRRDIIGSHDYAIGITVAKGWFTSRIGSRGWVCNWYGFKQGAASLRIITLDDDAIVKVVTDSTWDTSFGPLLLTKIYNGEQYDSRLDAGVQGWSTTTFDSGTWLDDEPAELHLTTCRRPGYLSIRTRF